jgi:hypothetical protein
MTSTSRLQIAKLQTFYAALSRVGPMSMSSREKHLVRAPLAIAT